METTIIYEVPGLKVSAKMRKAIAKLERKFGKLNKRFFVERNKGERVGRDAFRNAESGAVLYVFSNEYIKGYGNEKYGEILCPSC